MSDDHTSQQPTSRVFSRRRFLVVGGGGLLVAGLGTSTHGLLLGTAAAADDPTFQLDLTRPDDMVQLHFDFHNLILSRTTGEPQLVRKDAAKPAVVVVTFGSQHLMEETLPWANDKPMPTKPLGQLATQAVGTSQIAFTVPQTVKSLPYTEDGLFGWWQWVMRVGARALAPGAAVPPPDQLPALQTPPGPLETDLLLVDWLHLSPDQFSTWSHASRPVTRNGRTELWHTRLSLRAKNGRPASTGRPTLRALSYDPPPANTPFNTMVPGDGVPQKIVEHTTDYWDTSGTEPTRRTYVSPASTDLVLLSSVGSSLELEAYWPEPGTLAKWHHRSQLGRDNYVRIEQRGFLAPLGNKAILVSETERKISTDGRAYLLQREFILVVEPVKDLGKSLQRNKGREFPFRRLELTTKVTPDLPPAAQRPRVNDAADTKSFWITNSDREYTPFPVVATDWEGNRADFTMFLAFLYKEEARNGATLTKLIDDFRKFDNLEPTAAAAARPAVAPLDDAPEIDFVFREVDLKGQQVAFVPQPEPEDDATFPVSKFYFGAEMQDPTPAFLKALEDSDLPNIWPIMMAAKVELPAVAALAKDTVESVIGFDPDFVAKVPIPNDATAMYARVQQDIKSLGEVKAWLEDPTKPLPKNNAVVAAFTEVANQVGGVAVPNLTVGALSKKLGPLSGGIEALKKMRETGEFNPTDFFPTKDIEDKLKAKLLGGIDLADILDVGTSGDGVNGPKIVTNPIYPNGDKTNLPEAVEAVLDWKPKLKDNELSPFQPLGVDDRPASLVLHGKFRTDRDGKSVYQINGDLRDFSLYLVDRTGDFSFIKLVFTRFTFEAHNDSKPDLGIDIARVEFINQLQFVNTLKDFLQTAGQGPKIDIQPEGIEAGYTLAIPSVAVGAFALQNISFTASLVLPFDGSAASAAFAFCSRENQFTLTVYGFAGGGFFELALSTEGLKRVEAAIQFGGNLALNLFVASGSVSVMAGIYFKLELGERDRITLTGYVRVTGRLSVLGLITISAEFYLGLSYVNDNGENLLEGEARLRVSIDILFFSKTVELTVRKQFAGPSAGLSALEATAEAPEFEDLMSQSDWNTYCDAFDA